ncbi:peptidoglycan-binding domain-containing protein [Sorangium sp. So ce388]|uniref:peptidoglycan-binding domain-containing protein n=1 Tax=Sorangium sp. So ce388 TaxID=3133309 RepID=UPI003F5AF0FE
MKARILRLGSHGADVAALQDLLRERGHDPGPSDGLFGPRTAGAARAFQAARGLHADGIVGPQTRAELAVESTPERRRVPKTQTPLSPVGLMNILAWGHEAFFGEQPTKARLAVAWAHVAGENGRGVEVYNNNFGNITGFRWSGSVYVITVPERDPETNTWAPKEMLFRSHGAPQAGSADYWSVMEKSYGDALPLFDAGKPYDAAMKLGELAWFTEHADQYAKRMTLLYRAFPG